MIWIFMSLFLLFVTWTLKTICTFSFLVKWWSTYGDSYWETVFTTISLLLKIEYAFHYIDLIPLSNMKRAALNAIITIMWWLMWNFRSEILFSDQFVRKNSLIDKLIGWFYMWLVNRNRRISIRRASWMLNPLLYIPM